MIKRGSMKDFYNASDYISRKAGDFLREVEEAKEQRKVKGVLIGPEEKRSLWEKERALQWEKIYGEKIVLQEKRALREKSSVKEEKALLWKKVLRRKIDLREEKRRNSSTKEESSIGRELYWKEESSMRKEKALRREEKGSDVMHNLDNCGLPNRKTRISGGTGPTKAITGIKKTKDKYTDLLFEDVSKNIDRMAIEIVELQKDIKQLRIAQPFKK